MLVVVGGMRMHARAGWAGGQVGPLLSSLILPSVISRSRTTAFQHLPTSLLRLVPHSCIHRCPCVVLAEGPTPSQMVPALEPRGMVAEVGLAGRIEKTEGVRKTRQWHLEGFVLPERRECSTRLASRACRRRAAAAAAAICSASLWPCTCPTPYISLPSHCAVAKVVKAL